MKGNEYKVLEYGYPKSVVVYKDGYVKEIRNSMLGSDNVDTRGKDFKLSNHIRKKKPTKLNRNLIRFDVECIKLNREHDTLIYEVTVKGGVLTFKLELSDEFSIDEYEEVFEHQKSVTEKVNAYSKQGYSSPMEFSYAGACIDAFNVKEDHPFYKPLAAIHTFRGFEGLSNDKYSMRM